MVVTESANEDAHQELSVVVLNAASTQAAEYKETLLELQKECQVRKLDPSERRRIRYDSEVSHDEFGSLILHSSVVHNCHVTSDDNVIKPRAPDGGYGWVVLGAAFLSFVTNGFQFGSFSVMYVALVEYFQAERATVGWIGSLYNFTGNFFGLLLGSLVQQYGCRAVTSVGAAVGAAGIALSSLLVNIPYLYFTYGVLAGIGHGMVMLSSLVMLQRYFDKRRAMALGIGASGVSVGASAAVAITTYLLEVYGLGGAYLVASGVFLQNFVASALYRPLKASTGTLVRERCQSASSQSVVSNGDHDLVKKVEGNFIAHVITEENTCAKDGILVASCGDVSSRRKSPNTGLMKDLIDLSPLKEPKLLLLLLATLLYTIGAVPYYYHYMSRMAHMGFNRQTAVNFQTCMAVTTLISRLAWGFVANIKGVNRITLYAILVFIGALIVLTFAFVTSPVSVVIYGILHGIISGGYFCLQPTVLADVMGVEFIAKTTGLMTMTTATAVLIGIPLAGFVYDVTGSYDYPYIVIGCIHTVGGALLIVLDVLLRRQWKN